MTVLTKEVETANSAVGVAFDSLPKGKGVRARVATVNAAAGNRW